jgi:hypothetical protein
MVGGHVDVFNYIYERNPEFLPKRYRQQYNSKTADPLTWWSYEMIVRIYEIDPKLIRLETLYAHAIELLDTRVIAWTMEKIHDEENGRSYDYPIRAEEALEGYIYKRDWDSVRRCIKLYPRMIPSRDRITHERNAVT